MKEFLQARKQLVAVCVLAIVVLWLVLYVCGILGCFGCNFCGDSCGFWSCFESCTDCVSCMFGCDR